MAKITAKITARHQPCRYQFRCHQSRYQLEGFTLLELVVVLAITAVLTGIMVHTINFDSSEQRLNNNVQRFKQFYRATQDEALLSGKMLRLQINDKQLVLEKRQQARWITFHLDETSLIATNARSPFFDETIRVNIEPAKPLYFSPSGQSAVFRLTLTQGKFSHTIKGDALGRLTIED